LLGGGKIFAVFNNMKKLFYFLIPAMLILSCNNTTDAGNNTDTTQNLQDPALVQPPADNIPDSMRIVNDSVIVPERGRDTIRI
jgi:hypothetical protein